MKKIIFILTFFSIALSSCKKEENKAKQTCLKTYTHVYYTRIPTSSYKYIIEYNSSNKISKVITEINDALYQTQYCIYNSSNKLDSILEKNASGTLTFYYKINWTSNKMTGYTTPGGNTQLTYNSNGLIDKKIYSDGSYFRNEYKGDSVLLYYKPLSTPEEISARYNLSSTFKNPFLISGFEAEAFVTGFLFYYNNGLNALLPNIETAEISYWNGGNLYDQSTYTFEGDFNGYPLKRTSSTNVIDGNKSKETFTYEEF